MRYLKLGCTLLASAISFCSSMSLSIEHISKGLSPCDACTKAGLIQENQCTPVNDSEANEPEVLDCLCKLSDQKYWSYLIECSKCQSANSLDMSLEDTKKYYCDHSSSLVTSKLLGPTNGIVTASSTEMPLSLKSISDIDKSSKADKSNTISLNSNTDASNTISSNSITETITSKTRPTLTGTKKTTSANAANLKNTFDISQIALIVYLIM